MDSDWQNFRIDTRYNRIELVRRQNLVELRSGDKALQSVVDLDHPERLGLKNLESLIAILLFMPPPRRILLLGTAAGSLLHFLRHHYSAAEIIALDIDAEMIERLLELRLLPPPGNGLTYVYDDAAHFVDKCAQQFDLILVDLFCAAHSPAWLLEKNMLEKLRRLASAEGAAAHNLIIDSESKFKRFYRDLRIVFEGRTLCLPVAGFENTITYGFRAAPPARDLDQHRQQALELGAIHGIDYVQILAAIFNTNPIGGGVL